MPALSCFLLVVASYLLGSVSSAILVTRLWSGQDIRTLGDQNAGAVNVARSVGLLPAAIVGVVDLFKGALPVFTARFLGLGDACALCGVMAAVVGHSYPLYFRFRGGQGLAASFGGLLASAPLETFLVLPVFGLVYLVITGSAVTAALVSFCLLTGLNLWSGRPLVVVLSPLVLLMVMGLCAIPKAFLDWREQTDKKRLLAYWLSPKDDAHQALRVAVITDSVASLPQEWYRREQIHVVPMALILPEGVRRDGVDVEPREYYRRLRQDGLSPKTSAPSPGEFESMYQKLAKFHRSGVVITPPRELTKTWESARLGATMMPEEFLVEVVDSRTAGPAQGFVALAAARAVASGANLEHTLEEIQKAQRNVGFLGVLDTVKFLIEGGRAANLNRLLQTALRLYPLLYIHQGQIRLLGMARTKTKAVEQMITWLKENLPRQGLSLAVAHTDVPEEARALQDRLLAHFQPEEHFITELTPVIGAHSGPGLLGVAWWIHKDTGKEESAHG